MQLQRQTQPLHIQLNTYRTMVAAENLIVNLRTLQLSRNPVRHHKIINTPT